MPRWSICRLPRVVGKWLVHTFAKTSNYKMPKEPFSLLPPLMLLVLVISSVSELKLCPANQLNPSPPPRSVDLLDWMEFFKPGRPHELLQSMNTSSRLYLSEDEQSQMKNLLRRTHNIAKVGMLALWGRDMQAALFSDSLLSITLPCSTHWFFQTSSPSSPLLVSHPASDCQ